MGRTVDCLQRSRRVASIARRSAPLRSESTAVRRPRALVVDDDPFVLHVLSALLDECGIDCVKAVNGHDGLRRLSDELLTLDLLITDLVMPKLGGDALVMAVRELGGERDLPIVVASSHLDRARAEALRDAGADAVVDKSSGLQPVADAARALLSARGRLAAEEPAPIQGQPLARIAIRRSAG